MDAARGGGGQARTVREAARDECRGGGGDGGGGGEGARTPHGGVHVPVPSTPCGICSGTARPDIRSRDLWVHSPRPGQLPDEEGAWWGGAARCRVLHGECGAVDSRGAGWGGGGGGGGGDTG